MRERRREGEDRRNETETRIFTTPTSRNRKRKTCALIGRWRCCRESRGFCSSRERGGGKIKYAELENILLPLFACSNRTSVLIRHCSAIFPSHLSVGSPLRPSNGGYTATSVRGPLTSPPPAITFRQCSTDGGVDLSLCVCVRRAAYLLHVISFFFFRRCAKA